MNYKAYLLVILSGLLSSLPFNIEALSFLSWIGLVPLLYILMTRKMSFRQSLFSGFLFGISFYIPIYHWFTYMYGIEGLDVPKAAMIFIILLAWLGISLYQGFITGLIVPIANRFKDYKKLFPFLFAALWVLAEYLLGLGNFSLPWGRLYLTQYKQIPLIQSASLFGALFISFLIVLVNVYLAKALLLLANKSRRRSLGAFAAAFLIFFCNGLFGLIHLQAAPTPKKALRVSIAQAYLEPGEAWYDADLCYEKYMTLSKKALASNPDVIIWPETAVPVTLDNSNSYLDLYKSFCIENNVALVVGGAINEGTKTYNALLIIDKHGNVSKPYYKRRLVPFGEYVPLDPLIGELMKKMGLGDFSESLTPGTSSEPIGSDPLKIAPLICFDSVDGDLARQSIKSGGEIITLITNDSWFKNSRAVYEHNAHAVFRAVENSRYVLRSANAGVSAVIDQNGRIIKNLTPSQNEVINETAYSFDNTTLYGVLGDSWVYGCLLFAIGITIYDYIKKKRSA